MHLNQEYFELIFKDNFGELYDRAINVFQNYGRWLENQVIKVFLLGIDQGKIEIVLLKLEWFWQETLQFIHPQHRLGHWQVENLFRCLEKNILNQKIN
jgi:hypothetical protein